MKIMEKCCFHNSVHEMDTKYKIVFRNPLICWGFCDNSLIATEFFKYRQAQQTGVDTSVADTKNGAYPV